MQVALRLNTLMNRILQFQSAQKKSCKDLRFRVVKRNQNDISRCKQFEKYSAQTMRQCSFSTKTSTSGMRTLVDSGVVHLPKLEPDSLTLKLSFSGASSWQNMTAFSHVLLSGASV